jgi:hypothetical protein
MNCTQPEMRKVQWASTVAHIGAIEVQSVPCLAFTSWFVLVVLAGIALNDWYGLGPLKGLGFRV